MAELCKISKQTILYNKISFSRIYNDQTNEWMLSDENQQVQNWKTWLFDFMSQNYSKSPSKIKQYIWKDVIDNKLKCRYEIIYIKKVNNLTIELYFQQQTKTFNDISNCDIWNVFITDNTVKPCYSTQIIEKPMKTIIEMILNEYLDIILL